MEILEIYFVDHRKRVYKEPERLTLTWKSLLPEESGIHEGYKHFGMSGCKWCPVAKLWQIKAHTICLKYRVLDKNR